MLRRGRPRIAVVVGYVLAAVAFSWPLPLHMGTAFTGDPGGDTGVYVWNQWVFQYEALVNHHNPLTTEQILSLTQRVNLSQHNYTAFLNLLALPLIPWLGIVTTFNVVFLIVNVLTALATYTLARRVTPATRAEAWIAGLAFAWSPVLVARTTGHFSLVAAAPLPAFLLALINADRTRRPRDAALAGLCIAWAGFCDVYYAIYCVIIAGGYLLSRMVRVTCADTPASASWRWTLNLLTLSVAGLIVGLLLGRGGRLNVAGLPISIRGLYTPVLMLTVLIAARVAIELRPHLRVPVGAWSPAAGRIMLIGLLACAGPLSPVLYGLGERIVEGQFVSPPTLWRSSPRGLDLLALVEFNPSHSIARTIGDRQTDNGAEFVEFTGAVGLAALLVIVVAVWRANYRPRAGWIWLTAGFASLSLGPFVHFAGLNTYVPGPWALIRYVPIIGAARTPTRFAVVAALGVAVLLAGALAALGRRYPQRRSWIAAAAGVILAFELCPAPRTLYSASIPSIYQVIAADPRPVRVLQLPFGVRDGVSSAGNFTARYQYFQTLHGKRLIGGYLSRISRKRVGEVRAQPTLGALIALSEGRTLTPERTAEVAARGPRFISRSNLGYVVIDHNRASASLISFATTAWGLEPLVQEGSLVLYRPTVHSEDSPSSLEGEGPETAR